VNWTSYYDGIASLFEQGGLILWAILLASVFMWILLAERYCFHWFQIADVRDRLREEWQAQAIPLSTGMAFRRLRAIVSDLRAESRKNLLALHALVAILPLLGLLGTVSGMIKVFEVITVFGTGNTRGMAFGISEALVTTMAGLFTALSGLYFVSDLERRSEDIARRFESELAEE
jgi:biopolymer transport protein ExbB